MRIGLILSFVAVLNLGFFLPAVRADEIPTRIPSSSDADQRAVVAARLVELGVDAGVAKDQAAALPDDAVARYAENPDSIQLVSGLHAEELLLGLGFLVVLGLIAGGIFSDAD